MLLDHLRTNVLRGDTELTIDRDTPLAETGVLDSLGFMEFVNVIENQFDIMLEDDDYTPEKLATVAKCAALIAERQPTR